MDLFTLVARLGMDSSEYEKGISKAKGSFSELGSSISAKAVAMGNMISSALEKAVNVAADLGKSAVQNAADVTAEKAQFQATFGTMQGEAEKAFAAIEKSTGIFGTRLQKVGTKAFSQFAGAGIKGADGLTAMQKYTELAADAAAYYDITLEDADERLRSFLRGNTEAGDAIGLFTSESQRNSAAMEKYGQKWTKLTEAQKQMLMLDISEDIYKQSGAIGQAARESDAWTNVIGNLQEAWRQATGALGKPIVAVLTPVLQDVANWLNEPDTKLKIDQFGLTVANAINWVLNPTFPTWEEVKEGAQSTFDSITSGLETAVNWTLGKLGMPDAETIISDVKIWWTGKGSNTYERLKSVLSWTLGEWAPPATESFLAKAKIWWQEDAGPSLQSVLNWTIGELYFPAWVDLVNSVSGWWDGEIKPGIKRLTTISVGDTVEFPSVSTMIEKAKTWWNGIKDTINEVLMINIKANYGFYTQSGSGTLGTPQEGIDVISTPSMSLLAPGKAVGFDYVPYNNYLARLHEGEAVLTKAEATQWRRNGTGGGTVDTAALANAVAAAVSDALDGAFVDMDGERVGNLVTRTVSRNITESAHSRRFA